MLADPAVFLATMLRSLISPLGLFLLLGVIFWRDTKARLISACFMGLLLGTYFYSVSGEFRQPSFFAEVIVSITGYALVALIITVIRLPFRRE